MRQSDLVLDLNKLVKIGTSYAASLEAFHFDVALLEQAASLAKQLGSTQVRTGMPQKGTATAKTLPNRLIAGFTGVPGS